MRTMFAIAIAASIVSIVPAMAQSAGYFGAPSGHNTPGSGVGLGRPNDGYNGDNTYNNNGGYGYGDNRNEGFGFGYDNAPGRDSFGVANPSGAIEGRAAMEDDSMPIYRHSRRVLNGESDSE